MKTAVAVSGGMDSLLALALLKGQGHDLMAVHGLFLPAKPEDTAVLSALEEQCRALDVPLQVVDLRREFRERVAEPFVRAYAAGLTPNPCAWCNPRIKFGILFDRVVEVGADRLATGHYVRMADHPQWGMTLQRGVDPVKDQSYFLALVPGERLEKALFPLGDKLKKDTLAALGELGLKPVHSRESQEICFVPDDDYRKYLLESGLELPGGGNIELSDGAVLGRHEGLWRHTQGQRKGLGIAYSEPLYVLDKDIGRNALIVGTASELACHECLAREINFMVEPKKWPETVMVQTRYRQQAKPSRFKVRGTDLELSFIEPHARPTPGQVAAVYSEDGFVLGGGVIG